MVHSGAAAAIADRGEQLVRHVPALHAVSVFPMKHSAFLINHGCLSNEAFCSLDQSWMAISFDIHTLQTIQRSCSWLHRIGLIIFFI